MAERQRPNHEHLAKLREGVSDWNKWRAENLDVYPDLKGADLKNADLACADLEDADLEGADLSYTQLADAFLENASLVNANLSVAEIQNANFGGACLEGADLSSADLTGAFLARTDLQDTDFTNADLTRAKLRDTKLRRADLRDTRLRLAELQGADLKHADLRRADLRRADLHESCLVGADLRGVNLKYANLMSVNLEDANLNGAFLLSANLSRAGLRETDFTNADLSGANLFCADLSGAYFNDTTLVGADLTGASIGFASLDRVDLRKVKGLEAVEHDGPTSVSTQTLKMGRGRISTGFLKGCGLSDWEILAARLHNPDLRPDEVIDIGYEISSIRAASPIVPLSVFLSYTHDDQRFVERLENRFDQDGIRSWRDIHDLVAGPLEAQVDRAIGLQRATLLVLSEKSVESDWVRWEAERARSAEKKLKETSGERHYLLCPIALDDSWKECDWPGRLRQQIEDYNILDFSRWGSDDEFEPQYEKLKTGLGIYYRK